MLPCRRCLRPSPFPCHWCSVINNMYTAFPRNAPRLAETFWKTTAGHAEDKDMLMEGNFHIGAISQRKKKGWGQWGQVQPCWLRRGGDIDRGWDGDRGQDVLLVRYTSVHPNTQWCCHTALKRPNSFSLSHLHPPISSLYLFRLSLFIHKRLVC